VSLIRGVAVSGKMMVPGDGTVTASVTVSGPRAAAGSLEVGAEGRVTGRLGGQDVAATTELAGQLAHLGALHLSIPAIGWRPRPKPH
jgi:hypothetical protein